MIKMIKSPRELAIDNFEYESKYYLNTYINGNKKSVVETARMIKGTTHYDYLMLQFVNTPELYCELIGKINE